MAYTKLGFTDGETPLDAEHFNHMEGGIADMHAITETTTSNEIVWDGVVGDRVTVDIDGMLLVRVSDYAPEAAIFTEQGFTIKSLILNGETHENSYDAETASGMIASFGVESYVVIEPYSQMPLFVVVLQENADVEGIVFEKAGTYFASGDTYLTSLTSPLLSVPTTKIKKSALPDDVGGVVVDDTLSIAGAAADAYAVGDALAGIVTIAEGESGTVITEVDLLSTAVKNTGELLGNGGYVNGVRLKDSTTETTDDTYSTTGYIFVSEPGTRIYLEDIVIPNTDDSVSGARKTAFVYAYYKDFTPGLGGYASWSVGSIELLSPERDANGIVTSLQFPDTNFEHSPNGFYFRISAGKFGSNPRVYTKESQTSTTSGKFLAEDIGVRNTSLSADVNRLLDSFGGGGTVIKTANVAGNVTEVSFPMKFVKGNHYRIAMDGCNSETLVGTFYHLKNDGAWITLSKEKTVIDFYADQDRDSETMGITPGTDTTASALTFTLTEFSMPKRVETLEKDSVAKPLVRALIIGDSFSSNGMHQWINPMIAEFKEGSSFVTLGVVSATVRDGSNDRATYPYTSRPTDGTNKNTFACQIAKLKRLMEGNDLDSGETQLYTDPKEYPNVIIIAGGQNDGVDSEEKVSNYVGQIEKIVTGVWTNNTAGTALQSNQSACVLTPIEETDRTSFAGAYRYLIEELHGLFPNAQIFIATCVSVSYHHGYSTVTPRHSIAEQQRLCAGLFSVPVIDWFAESCINSVFNYASGSGTESDPYILDNATEDTMDSLHPNANGGKKLGRLAAKVIMQRLLSIGK